MAFFSKVGNVLRQTASASKQIIPDFSAASNPSFYQFIRCMSSNKVFIGGLSWGTDDQGLREAFSHYGEVVDARVIMDRETSRSRGFGFVTFTSDEEASSAIQAMDGRDLQGRQVRVNYANERPQSNFGGGGGYGSYGGGGGGGYGSYGGGGGGNYGGDAGYVGGGANYGSGDGGNFGQSSGGNYESAGANSFDSGSNFGVSGGVGGNDSIGADGGFASGQQFGSSGMDNVSGDFNQGPQEGNFRDDDEPDFAKRA